MTANTSNNAPAVKPGGKPVNMKNAERSEKQNKAQQLIAASELAARIRIMPDGSRMFERFNRGEIVEHWFLLVSFTTLAVTGLMQRYASVYAITWFVNVILGGIETLRILHHLSAFVFGAQSIYHLGRIFYMWFIKGEPGAMIPGIKDATDMVGMMKFNAGWSKERPQSDRYSVEEKLEYWALVWGTAVMGLTGLMQWFPSITTRILPGSSIPIARMAHSLEAVLAAAAIATWHLYHSLIKENNTSIYTGLMSEHEMKENHLLEYQRILAASEYMQNTRTPVSVAAPAEPQPQPQSQPEPEPELQPQPESEPEQPSLDLVSAE